MIEGYIEKIIYRNEENGYTVLSVMVDEKLDLTQVLVGYIEGAAEGLYIQAEGEEVEHPYYETQYKVTAYELRMPADSDSMERYLASGAIKGIGPVLAMHIVKKFKKDTFRIIEFEPERLAEIKGISERKAREIGIQFHETQDIRQAMMFLGKYGINARLAVKIYNEYGEKLYKIIEENPYKLAEDIAGVGFRIADEIARRAGIGLDSEFRVRSAVIYTLSQSGGLGHMYLPKDMLIRKVSGFLVPEGGDIFEGGYEEVIEQQLMALQLERKIILKEIDGTLAVYGSAQYHTELNTARMLLDLNLSYPLSESEWQIALERLKKKSEIELDELQQKAVRQAAASGLVIITGGPGTGKTTVINTIIRYFEQEGLELRLAAPTGRAAKRMTEATGYQAQTIHRLLELNGGVETDSEAGIHFERNAQNPLEADVVIIDEMSMVDIYLAHALLEAVVPGTHLILVGDVNQLPSVGPGNVLKDIIYSGAFPVIELSTVYRQEEGSDIVMNAHRINHGEYPVMNNKSRDFFLLPRANPQAVIEEVGKLVSVKMPKYVQAKPYEVQVLTPMRQGELGVENLNREMQRILNPPDGKKQEYESHNTIFREGDKVMQIKNNYKLEWAVYDASGYFEQEKGMGVFNGDIGVIREIDSYAQEVKVLMDDERVVVYDFKMLEELELAYAITIHKSQGSEYPAVVLPILNGPRVLLHRNLLYTAITRAKKCVVIVGNGYKIHEMVDNADEQKRYSGLQWAICEQMRGEE